MGSYAFLWGRRSAPLILVNSYLFTHLICNLTLFKELPSIYPTFPNTLHWGIKQNFLTTETVRQRVDLRGRTGILPPTGLVTQAWNVVLSRPWSSVTNTLPLSAQGGMKSTVNLGKRGQFWRKTRTYTVFANSPLPESHFGSVRCLKSKPRGKCWARVKGMWMGRRPGLVQCLLAVSFVLTDRTSNHYKEAHLPKGLFTLES